LHVVQKGDRIWDDELFGVFYVSNPDRGELVHGEEATSAVTGPRHGSRERRPNLRPRLGPRLRKRARVCDCVSCVRVG